MTIPAKLLQLQKLQGDAVAMLTLLYSPEGMEVFTEMAQDDFSLGWSQLNPQEAQAILFLLNVAQQIVTLSQEQPQSLMFIPKYAFDGFFNVVKQLSPYRAVLTRIEAGELTPYEAKILAGEIQINQGKGIAMSMDQLNALLVNA